MDNGKYIIVKERGHEVAILFHPLIEHISIAKRFFKEDVISAGFFTSRGYPTQHLGGIEVAVFGQSDSLEKGTRPKDKELIEELLRGAK